ncbi:MAG TPA: PLP-dependent aminotransferase family protein [Gaiellales bacterium]|nr:PLP-dependent aminotransferase family protein [Gaiellales bacterium]
MSETSQPVELLLSVTRGGGRTLGDQIEDQVRRAIRGGALRDGTQLPSTRDLARQLGISRRVVVDVYAQLGAEGYLELRQGARPHVSGNAAVAEAAKALPVTPAHRLRFDFRPSRPDLSAFPRASWLRSLRSALATMTDAELGYGDPRGATTLRSAMADYLGRVRGVVAEPNSVVVTAGYAQGLAFVCRALAANGAKRIGIEDPSNLDDQAIVLGAGLEPVPIGVDDQGLRVDELVRAAPDGVIVTPAHQQPTGVVLSRPRRGELVAWLRERHAVAIEDDYDAEYRYDRAAVGALQGLAPEHVVYGGTTSKTLAPALRLGWLVVPANLLQGVVSEKLLADRGAARIEEYAFADFVTRGELDRHLRRMRSRYRKQRDALVQALAQELPEAVVTGISAGLHVTVQLPEGYDAEAIREEAARRRILFNSMSEYRADGYAGATLMLGYGSVAEPAIAPGVHEIAEAVRASIAASS